MPGAGTTEPPEKLGYPAGRFPPTLPNVIVPVLIQCRRLAEDAMEVLPLTQQENRNPRTIEEGRALVRHVESLFMPWNIDALVDGFTEDCTVRFGTVPEFRGRAALREFFTARSARQKDYRLRKQLRVLAGDTMTNVWDGEWQDVATGVSMKGFGVELWILRDGKIAVWETAFNVARADRDGGVAEMLG
jgi:nuclear transport factor 2 (NTF2) superfamily protein